MVEEVKMPAAAATYSDSPGMRNYQENSPSISQGPHRMTGPGEEFCRNWVELRLMGQQPDRRSYHSSFIFDKKLYVYGGLDIREGSINSLYELNLLCLQELNNDELHYPGGEPMQSSYKWRLVTPTGNAQQIPGRIAYHTSCVYKDNMYLFGGNHMTSDQNDGFTDKIHYLNMRTMSWSVIRTRGDQVMIRDEHTGVVDAESTSMIIFGGFQSGERTNQTSIYNFTTNMWENVTIPNGQPVPCSRSGHSASIYNGMMYIFGGKNDSSEKLNDLWVFNIAEKKWVQIEAEGDEPFERSGHSSAIFDDYLAIFGGIWDVTKELNDLHLYSFANNNWITVQASANSPTIGRSPMRQLTQLNNGNMGLTSSGLRDSPIAKNDLDSPFKANRTSLTKKNTTNSVTKVASST